MTPHRNIRNLVASTVVAICGGWLVSEMSGIPFAQPAHAAGYDRPTGDPHQSRSVVIAKNGIVATSHPLAAQAGLDVLKKGGNAVDAAIATNAMIGLVEPMSCGIGGDLFAIYWDAKTQKLYGLNASGRSPYTLNRDVFKQKGLTQIPPYTPLAWSVPGCVDGWDMLLKRFGTQKLADLLQPAIHYAEEGFPVTEIIAAGWAGDRHIKDWPDSVKTYLPSGRAPRTGEIFKNPYLGQSYRAIAQHGRDAFYKGSIAEQIVAFSKANGGYFSMKDLADHTSNWVDPVSTNYRGYDVWELPPNGQGIAALQILNVLEGYDIRGMGHNSPEFLHLFVEAKKLAFADRATYYADPDFNSLPVAELISKPYADKQRKRINPDRAATTVDPGNPALARADTIYLTVVDKDRNCCSLIQSNFHSFGSSIVPGNVGFVIQNRGELFALDDKHLNRLEPHKRPFHTIIPAFVTKDGQPWFCFGVMGGDMQAQGHAQIVINLVDFGMNVQAAGDSARVNHEGSQTPTGLPMESGGGTVYVESGIPDKAVESLKQRGHQVVRGGGGRMGGYQGILIDSKNGTLHGATEARKDGAAVGY